MLELCACAAHVRAHLVTHTQVLRPGAHGGPGHAGHASQLYTHAHAPAPIHVSPGAPTCPIAADHLRRQRPQVHHV